jgi:GT2 family glycosyltransferase
MNKIKKCINFTRAKSPKVAIIILNWNGWKDTIECLESVFRNDYPNYQAIVIDNGSGDESIGKIESWAKGEQKLLTPEYGHPLYHLSHPAVPKPIPYIKYDRDKAEVGGLPKEEKLLYEKLPSCIPHPMILIQAGNNLGFAGGNNVGMRYALARGDFKYIWLLNNDTVVDKDSLSMLVKKAEEENLGAVGSKLLLYQYPGNMQTAGGGKILPLLGITKAISGPAKAGIQFRKSLDYISGASLLMHLNVLKDVGLFDEHYFLYWEEVDWCLRVRQRNYALDYQEHSRVWHKLGSSMSHKNLLSDYYNAMSTSYFLKKNYKHQLFLALPINFMWKTLKRLGRRQIRNIGAILKGYLKGINMGMNA